MATVNRSTVTAAKDPFYLLTSRINSNVRGIITALYKATRTDPILSLFWVGSGWRTGSSDHETGRAADLIISERVEKLPTAQEKRAGQTIADWLTANADTLGVEVIVWNGQSWTPPRRTWKALPRTRTHNANGTVRISDGHFDHVHVRFSGRGRYTPITNSDAPAPKPTPPATSSQNLRSGTRGDQVKQLQTGLNKVFPAYRHAVTVRPGSLLTIDGIFGPATEAWVKEFQRRAGGLVIDGIVGPRTRAKLAAYGVKL